MRLNLLNFLLVWNFDNKIVCCIYTKKIGFFVKPISNPIIKNNQYFVILAWIELFNISLNVVDIIRVLNKGFRISLFQNLNPLHS